MYKFLATLICAAALTLSVYPHAGLAQENPPWTGPLKKCWSFPSDQVSNLNGASDNESVVIIPFNNNVLTALDVRNGKPIWKSTFEKEFNSNLVINGKTLFITLTPKIKPELPIKVALDKTESTYSEISSIDIDSGLNNWARPLNSRSDDEMTYINKNISVVFSSSKNGEITAFGIDDGEKLWNVNLGTSLSSSPIVNGNHIFIPTANKTIVVLSASDGGIVNQIPTGIVPSAIDVREENILVGDSDGNVDNLGIQSGKLKWRARTGGRIRQINPIEQNTLVVSDDNFAYLLDDGSGDKLWKRRLSGRILGSSLRETQIGVFLSNGSSEAIVIELNSGKIINRIPTEETGYFVSAPIIIGNRIVLSTNTGLYAYGSDCDENSRPNTSQKINP